MHLHRPLSYSTAHPSILRVLLLLQCVTVPPKPPLTAACYMPNARDGIGRAHIPARCTCMLLQSNTDGFADAVFKLLLASQVRIRLVRPFVNKEPYSISEIVVTARQNCHGHGLPDSNGKCVCKHSTTGTTCEQCQALFNALPRWYRWTKGAIACMYHTRDFGLLSLWSYTHSVTPLPHSASTGTSAHAVLTRHLMVCMHAASSDMLGTPFECKQCECHGHATSCKYDNEVGGGVCQKCAVNTGGEQCERCTSGFYRKKGVSIKDSKPCTECTCEAAGVTSSVCVRDVFAATGKQTPGQCLCKANVQGAACNKCKETFMNLQSNNPAGCAKCSCKGMCVRVQNICVLETC